MSSKSPAFQFYPRDWLDMRVMRMSYEAQGVYMRLLCHIWNDTETQYSIRNEPAMLARILGLPKKKFFKIFSEIQWPGDPIFQEKDGFLVSKRLREEKVKQRDKSEKRKKAADARWGNVHDECNANALQVVCPSSSTSISSSTSTSTSKNKTVSSEPETDPEPPVIFIPILKDKKSGKTEYPVTQSDIDEWEEAYPAVDIVQCLRNIREWNLSNPKKRKTLRGVRGHITSWMARDQDRGGTRKGGTPYERTYETEFQ